MANFINTSLDKPTYSLVLNSNYRINPAGTTHNNCQFNINWDDFLPREYQMYKVCFNFQTTAGNYKDGTYTNYIAFSSAIVKCNFGGRSYSFDTASTSSSTTLGIIQRDIQVSGTASNCLSCYYLFNAPRTINRPTTNLITFQIINQYQSTFNATTALTNYLVDTNTAGTSLAGDMTPWTMLLEFIPISTDVIKSQGTV